jgi:hypothetical protein
MKKGFANGLTDYGDRDFALFLRRSFAWLHPCVGPEDQVRPRPCVCFAPKAVTSKGAHVFPFM